MTALPHAQVLIRHPEVRAEGAPRRTTGNARQCTGRRPSRLAEFIIGPAKGRTRWLAPQDDGDRPEAVE